MHWHEQSTAHSKDNAPQRFQITHPYHPLFQQEFVLVQYRRNWGEDRVYFPAENRVSTGNASVGRTRQELHVGCGQGRRAISAEPTGWSLQEGWLGWKKYTLPRQSVDQQERVLSSAPFVTP